MNVWPNQTVNVHDAAAAYFKKIAQTEDFQEQFSDLSAGEEIVYTGEEFLDGTGLSPVNSKGQMYEMHVSKEFSEDETSAYALNHLVIIPDARNGRCTRFGYDLGPVDTYLNSQGLMFN